MPQVQRLRLLQTGCLLAAKPADPGSVTCVPTDLPCLEPRHHLLRAPHRRIACQQNGAARVVTLKAEYAIATPRAYARTKSST
jgi:hypothetical protein